MNESEWNSCTSPEQMLDWLRAAGKASDRKLALFAVGVCRRLQHLLTKDYVRSCREVLGVRERHADGLAAGEELRAAEANAGGDAFDAPHMIAHPGEADSYAVSCAADAAHARDALEAARHAARAAAYDAVARRGDGTVRAIAASWEERRRQRQPDPQGQWEADETRVVNTPPYLAGHAAEQAAQATLLRDLFGPLPFRMVAVDPALPTWHAGTVVQLAEAIYQQRMWGDMPLLGDLLEEAGCRDEDMLQHCREQGGVHARGCWLLDLLLGKP
jgi:hypothetical protein